MKKLISIISAICLSSAVHAQTINNLGSASALTGTESVPIFQTANPAVKTTTQAIGNTAAISIAPGCGASTSPNPIVASSSSATASVLRTPVTISGASPAVSVTGSPFGTNCGATVYLTNASADTPTIPEAGTTGYALGFFMTVCNTVAFTKTFTPASPGTIGGASTYSLAAGTAAAPTCIGFQSDGVSNYSLNQVPGGSSGLTVGTTSISSGSNGQYLYDNSGTLGNQALPVGSSSQQGIVETDGKTVAVSAGIISAGVPANYTTGGTVWYQPITLLQTSTGGALQSGTIVCGFGGVPATVVAKGLGGYETTTSSGNHVSFAVYSVSGGTLTYISDVGSIALGASNNQPVSGNFSSATGGGPATVTLNPGTLYAFCTNSDNTTVIFQSWASATSGLGAAVFVGSTTLGNTDNGANNMNGKQIATTYGTWSGTISLGSMSDSTNGTSKIPSISFLVN